MTLRFGQKRLVRSRLADRGFGRTVDGARRFRAAERALPLPDASSTSSAIRSPTRACRCSATRSSRGSGRLNPAGGGDQTDDTGAYRIYRLAPGDYYVSATLRAGNGPFVDDHNNDTTSYASTYYPGTGSVAEAQRLTLGVGQEQPNVNFALQPVRTI